MIVVERVDDTVETHRGDEQHHLGRELQHPSEDYGALGDIPDASPHGKVPILLQRRDLHGQI